MAGENSWVTYPMFCFNCSSLVLGMKNRKGSIRYHCGTCGCNLVRTDKSRRHATIDIFAPDGEEALKLSLMDAKY